MTRSRLYPFKLPPSTKGMTIGLYGGSFNPPHDGHRHVATMALKRLQLDRLWCLVTPGNPLKDTNNLPSINQRMTATSRLMDHPAIDVTGFEQQAKTRFTAETLDWLITKRPEIRFVWVMGADNLRLFHKWQRWKDIFHQIPIAIIDRPGYSLSPLSATAAQHFAKARLDEENAKMLAYYKSPVWTFLHGPRSDLSSSDIRSATRTAKLAKSE